MQIQQKITPFLSFHHEAEEAAHFYVSLMPDSAIERTLKNPANGKVMTVEFRLAGLTFVALNVEQSWEFTHAFSLAVNCDTQEEIDRLWNRLSEGGEEVQCGWLKDKFGVSWQVVPSILSKMLADSDAARAQRVMGALMQMTKLDLARLQQAYETA